jgi:hypothetical protein
VSASEKVASTRPLPVRVFILKLAKSVDPCLSCGIWKADGSSDCLRCRQLEEPESDGTTSAIPSAFDFVNFVVYLRRTAFVKQRMHLLPSLATLRHLADDLARIKIERVMPEPTTSQAARAA